MGAVIGSFRVEWNAKKNSNDCKKEMARNGGGKEAAATGLVPVRFVPANYGANIADNSRIKAIQVSSGRKFETLANRRN